MKCRGCGGQVHDWFGDAWCDSCGGVMGKKDFLLFRHVATVDGPGGRLPVVWDVSQAYYKFRHPRELNPRYVKAKKEAEERKAKGLPPKKQLDPLFRVSPVLTISGTLDAVIAMAQPIAKGDSNELPSLSAAPTATDEEKFILGVT